MDVRPFSFTAVLAFIVFTQPAWSGPFPTAPGDSLAQTQNSGSQRSQNRSEEAAGSEEVLWQIGKFDESSGEFQKPPKDFDTAKEPVYVVGKSDPAVDWWAFQPGTSNGKAGYHPHPFTIRFDIEDAPSGDYELEIALLAYSPRLPWLEIAINGHRGWFYQHPKLAYSAGDDAVFYLPYYSTADIRCRLPRQYLVKGTNTLVFTALDEPGPRDDSQPSGFPWPGSSGIIYDAVALRHMPKSTSRTTALVIPTIFYVRSGDRLEELVDVYVTGEKISKDMRAVLVLGTREFPLSAHSDRDFGEQKFELSIPENQWRDDGEIRIESGGHHERLGFHARPARKWTVLLAPNVHLDVGYSDYVPKVAELHSRTVDEALAMIQRNPAFRFNLDGSWVVEQFMNGRNDEQKSRFLNAVRQRKIQIPADYASNFTGFSNIECLIRALYYSADFARRHNTPFDFSIINDVPNYSGSYASVLHAAGLQYLIAGSDAYRAPFLLYNHFNEQSPQWWEGADGGRVLVWYSRHYHQMAGMFGLPPQIANGHDSLPRFLQAYDRPEYKPNTVLMFGTQVENTDLFPEQASLAGEWNRKYAYPKIEYSGLPDAMERIAREAGDSIPVVRGDENPYWEDGMIADAHLTAMARESQQRILSAEKFSTISSFVDAVAAPDRQVIGRAWKDLLLIDEHSWQSYESVTDPDSEQSIRQGAWKDAHGDNARRQIDFTLGRSLSAIADAIRQPAQTLVVFNSLNWKRSELVEVDVDKGVAPFDATNERLVPYQILASGQSYDHIRFLAENVPPVGYKSYALRPAPKQDQTTYPALNRTVLESPYYRVELDPASGAIRSIFDKGLNKQLVDPQSAFRFDQYLYVTGADSLPNRLVQYNTVSPVPELSPHPSKNGRVVSVSNTPFGQAAILESSAPNTPRITTEVLVFKDEKKIEFINRIEKTKVYSKEAAYFAFPFAMDDPEVRYETQNGFVDPRHDLLPGAGLEWFNVQHWLSAEQNGAAATLVPVDAPMVTIGDIARGTWPKEYGHRKGTIFSYILSNYTPEGYPAGQDGTFTFRYVLTSASGFSPVDAARFGWGALSPLELDEIKLNDKPESIVTDRNTGEGSFLRIDQPNVVLVNWKLAEDGKGSILRLLETGGKSSTVHIDIPMIDISVAWKCNAVEGNQEQLQVAAHKLTVDIAPFQVLTVRIEGTRISEGKAAGDENTGSQSN
jgi:alpha-mannosidase